MEHTCKLCFRRFANGRAMGGHMRSHVTSSTPPVKAQLPHYPSASSTSASSREAPAVAAEELEERGSDEDAKGMGFCYSLRENPRKSFRLVDPEFSSSFAAVDAGSSSVVQDGESETESSRDPPSHGHRSKRPRPVPLPPTEVPEPEPEPASSVSDTTPEEDVALSLMMLSRDFWTKTKSEAEDNDEKQQSDGWEEDDETAEEKGQIVAARLQPPPRSPATARGRSKYQCGTCKKVFRSYQALGGHRASHKKSRGGCIPAVQAQIHDVESSEGNADREANKVHECSFCFRVFASGQALGGHKRSHLASSAAATTITISSPAPLPPPPSSSVIAKCGESSSFIDLNLPAPLEDEAELSAVSDAEFVANYPSN